ncbi:MAG: hypothetical protein HQK60_19325, partial [Deltaproteobacteria bacterium]|nr:hypothetical protein [Deltaproteobacteria bacterium]
MIKIRLGTKIGGGFGLLILMACVLGGMAIWNMMKVEKDATRLAKAYVPEVSLANNMERYSLLTIFEIRGYGFTENVEFLDNGRKNLELVKKYIKEAKELSNKYDYLKKLHEAVSKVEQKTSEYENLLKETVTETSQLEALRKDLDKAAAGYMKNCHSYLAGQNDKLQKALTSGADTAVIADRIKKITLINEIIDHGNDIRIHNFKAQALDDYNLLAEAIKLFDKVDSLLQEIRPITKSAEDIKELEEIKTAGDTYKKYLGSLHKVLTGKAELNKKRVAVANDVLAEAKGTAEKGMEEALHIAEATDSSLSLASWVMIIGLIIAVIVGVVIAVIITRGITKPLNRIIGGLADASDQVAAASNQVASASQSLAEGSSEQAAAVEETSSSMEELASMTKQNADNANQADGLAKEAKDVTITAGESMTRLTNSMNEISKASEETSKIIKTIDEIAF